MTEGGTESGLEGAREVLLCLSDRVIIVNLSRSRRPTFIQHDKEDHD